MPDGNILASDTKPSLAFYHEVRERIRKITDTYGMRPRKMPVTDEEFEMIVHLVGRHGHEDPKLADEGIINLYFAGIACYVPEETNA